MDNKRGEEKCLRRRLNLLLRILLYITKYIIRKFTRDVIVIDHATDSIVPKINTERTTVSKVINDVDTPYINRCFVGELGEQAVQSLYMGVISTGESTAKYLFQNPDVS